MDFSQRLDALQQRVTASAVAGRAAANKPEEHRRQRIGQAQDEIDRAPETQSADSATGGARNKWAQLKADATAKREDLKAKIDKRTRQVDATVAADEADWAEADAADALDLAAWAVDNAQLAMLDAIDARAYADELTARAPS